jgi:hypothetical protein
VRTTRRNQGQRSAPPKGGCPVGRPALPHESAARLAPPIRRPQGFRGGVAPVAQVRHRHSRGCPGSRRGDARRKHWGLPAGNKRGLAQTPRPPRRREKMNRARAMITKTMRMVHSIGAPGVDVRQGLPALFRLPCEWTIKPHGGGLRAPPSARVGDARPHGSPRTSRSGPGSLDLRPFLAR